MSTLEILLLAPVIVAVWILTLSLCVILFLWLRDMIDNEFTKRKPPQQQR